MGNKSIGVECLPTHRGASNLGDQLDLILRHLHGQQNCGKLAALIRCLKIVKLCIIYIVASEHRGEPCIKPINEHVTDAHGKASSSRKWLHSIHHALITDKDRVGNKVPGAVDIRLLDVLEGGVGLTGIPLVNFRKDGTA